ncbi:MAG: hypothetical protein J6V07_05985 [Clostridia bacterium]|nr:hypothetical protein [Clostridia bacterium]
MPDRLKKGYYQYREAGSYLALKQFIVSENEEGRCLLLRFINTSELELHAVKYLVTQLDVTGREICHHKVLYENLQIRPGTDYYPRTGILLRDSCVDFRVRILYVISDRYQYVFRNGQAVPLYDIRGYEHPPAGRKTERDGVRLRRRFAKSHRLFGFLAFLGIILIAISYLLSLYIEADPFGKGGNIALQEESTCIALSSHRAPGKDFSLWSKEC